jgi:hypothetical protein
MHILRTFCILHSFALCNSGSTAAVHILHGQELDAPSLLCLFDAWPGRSASEGSFCLFYSGSYVDGFITLLVQHFVSLDFTGYDQNRYGDSPGA